MNIQKDITDGNILVATVMDGSPAEKAGMRPNDKIVKIEGESVTPMDTQEIQNKIKGEKRYYSKYHCISTKYIRNIRNVISKSRN